MHRRGGQRPGPSSLLPLSNQVSIINPQATHEPPQSPSHSHSHVLHAHTRTHARTHHNSVYLVAVMSKPQPRTPTTAQTDLPFHHEGPPNAPSSAIPSLFLSTRTDPMPSAALEASAASPNQAPNCPPPRALTKNGETTPARSRRPPSYCPDPVPLSLCQSPLP